jgi:hypothetical protein
MGWSWCRWVVLPVWGGVGGGGVAGVVDQWECLRWSGVVYQSGGRSVCGVVCCGGGWCHALRDQTQG